MSEKESELPLETKHDNKGITDVGDMRPAFDDSKDVVSSCPNGQLKDVCTSRIYVIVRIVNNAATGASMCPSDVTVLGYSYSPEFAAPYMEEVAARALYGSSYESMGKAFITFDPIDENGDVKPLPTGRFMMWDEPNDDEDDGLFSRSQPMPSLSIYESLKESTDAGRPEPNIHRAVLVMYKADLADLTVNDYMAVETAGDRKFLS